MDLHQTLHEFPPFHVGSRIPNTTVMVLTMVPNLRHWGLVNDVPRLELR